MPSPAFHGNYYIGHSGEYFPYCYRNRFTNKLEGIYLFVWKLIADQTGAAFTPKFVKYDSSDSVANLTFDGLQGEVLRGGLLTAFEGTNMVPGMPFLHRYSMPFFESSVSLYETRRTTPSGQPSSYIVYPQDLPILFLAILLFSSVIDSARHVVSKMMGKPYTDNSLQHTFLLPSIVVVLAIHNAGYSGNSLSHPPVKTTYEGLMRGMQSGSRQFVIEAKYLITYKSDFDHFMTPASRPFFVAQSIFERFEKLCSDPSLVNAIFTLDLATVSAIKGLCTLVRIPTPGYTGGLENFDDSQAEVFWVGVHVRHGMDITMHSRNLKYGHTAAPLEYFEKAMQEMRERHENRKSHFSSAPMTSTGRRGISRKRLKANSLSVSEARPGRLTFNYWRAVMVLYYSGWPRVGSSLDRQLNKTEYYIDEWKAIEA